jgi:hypothetical protein
LPSPAAGFNWLHSNKPWSHRAACSDRAGCRDKSNQAAEKSICRKFVIIKLRLVSEALSAVRQIVATAASSLARTMSQTDQTNIVEVHYESDCSTEQIEHVLAALDRWSRRTGKHVTHQRASDRHAYRTTVIVEPNEQNGASSTLRQFFHVPARNVSKTGLGFIAPPIFIPKMLSDATPLIRAESAFKLGMKIKVTLGPPTGMMPTLCGEIVRVRPVHLGFLEIGVQFLDRGLEGP